MNVLSLQGEEKKKGWFEQTYSQYPNYIIFSLLKILHSSFVSCLFKKKKVGTKGKEKPPEC